MMGFFARHPIASSVGGIILLFLLYRMFSGGGSSQAVSSGGLDPNAVAAATALQQSQLQANAQTQQYQLAAQAQNAQIAGQVQVAGMQQQLGLAQIAAGSTAAQQQTQAAVDIAGMQAQSTNLASSLAAQVQQAGLNAQVQVANIGANVTNTQTGAMVQMNQANQNTIQAITGIQAGVVNNQTAVQMQQVRNAGQFTVQKNLSPCFLTTAACEHMGMPDDCYVLTTLRTYRDGWMKVNAPGEVGRYYREAPGIVARLDARPDAGMVYTLMWHDFILPAVHCVERGQNRAAFAIYANMFETFKQLAVAGVPRPANGMVRDVRANDDGTVSFSIPHGEVVDIESRRIVESDGAA